MNKEISFELARQNETDAKLVMDWRNDRETRKMSIHMDRKIWPDFYQDYLKYFYLNDLPPLFVTCEMKRIGFIFFKPVSHPNHIQKKTVEISINISPQYRGKGLGIAVLLEACLLAKNNGYDALYALVKNDNETSKQTFLKAGFNQLDDIEKNVFDLNEKVKLCQFSNFYLY